DKRTEVDRRIPQSSSMIAMVLRGFDLKVPSQCYCRRTFLTTRQEVFHCPHDHCPLRTQAPFALFGWTNQTSPIHVLLLSAKTCFFTPIYPTVGLRDLRLGTSTVRGLPRVIFPAHRFKPQLNAFRTAIVS